MRVALAVTVHDPGGHITPGLDRAASGLRGVFSGIAANATDLTHERLLSVLRGAGAAIMTHSVGNVAGRSRRNAVGLALETVPDRVLYCDLDHVIRWIEQDPDELRAVVTNPNADDVVVVGRSPQAFARSPARLRETEAIGTAFTRLPQAGTRISCSRSPAIAQRGRGDRCRLHRGDDGE